MVVKVKCPFPGCTRARRNRTVRSLCDTHRKQIDRGAWQPINSHRNRRNCRVEDCDKKPIAYSLCRSHYVLIASATLALEDERSCEAPGCRIKHYAKGFCRSHYSIVYYQRRYGHIIEQIEKESA